VIGGASRVAQLVADEGRAAETDDFFRSRAFYAAEGVSHTLVVGGEGEDELALPLLVHEIGDSGQLDAITPYGYPGATIRADRGSPVIDQLAFADFLSHGEFDRHLRRMRPVYRRRRDALLRALRERLPALEPAGVAAGLHLVAWLPPGMEEDRVVEAAARRGVSVSGLAPYRRSGAVDHGGLIFGYGTLNERAITEGIDVLAAAIDEIAGA